MERLCSWPSWISARTRSHSRKGPERPLVPPDHGCDGETVSPSPQSNSQTSAGIAVYSSVASGTTRGHPLRHQAEPRCKVAPSCKGNSVADRGYHCACNDRADTRNRHQLPAARVAARQGLDLIRHIFDSLIEMRPVADEVLNNPDHT